MRVCWSCPCYKYTNDLTHTHTVYTNTYKHILSYKAQWCVARPVFDAIVGLQKGPWAAGNWYHTVAPLLISSTTSKTSTPSTHHPHTIHTSIPCHSPRPSRCHGKPSALYINPPHYILKVEQRHATQNRKQYDPQKRMNRMKQKDMRKRNKRACSLMEEHLPNTQDVRVQIPTRPPRQRHTY